MPVVVQAPVPEARVKIRRSDGTKGTMTEFQAKEMPTGWKLDKS